MYTSPDEARSDLFLSVAAYVFGPLILTILVNLIPLDRIPGVSATLALVEPVLFTVAVPFLLIRYRNQSLRDYGLSGADRSLPTGVLVAVPIVLAGLVGAVLAGAAITTAVPLAALGRGSSGGVVTLLVRALFWPCLLLLAAYGTVKARDAFRSHPVTLTETVVRVGRILAIAGGAALALLITSDLITGSGAFDGLTLVSYLLQPAGVVAAVWLALRREGGSTVVSMPLVVTPVVIMAVGPFALTFNAFALITGVYFAALFGGIGLVVAIIVERTRQATGVIVMGLLIALLSLFGGAEVFG
ncbi:MAG: hypothetical protein ACR2KP_17610 [Egibacteraceae bacterium]